MIQVKDLLPWVRCAFGNVLSKDLKGNLAPCISKVFYIMEHLLKNRILASQGAIEVMLLKQILITLVCCEFTHFFGVPCNIEAIYPWCQAFC